MIALKPLYMEIKAIRLGRGKAKLSIDIHKVVIKIKNL